MSEEQPQNKNEENGDDTAAKLKALWQQIVLACRAFGKKAGLVFRRAIAAVRPKLRSVKKTWTTSTWPKLKSGIKKAGSSLQASTQGLLAKLKRKDGEPAKRRKDNVSPQELRTRYDRQPVEGAAALADVTNAALPKLSGQSDENDHPETDDTKGFGEHLGRGTRSVMTRMAAMTASVKNAYGNRRQRSTMYKPYRYQGIGSRLKRHSRQKVYRLKGYTTVARVNRKRRREYMRRQRNILLISVLLIVVIIMIFMWIDPVPKLRDLLHDLGFITPPSS